MSRFAKRPNESKSEFWERVLVGMGGGIAMVYIGVVFYEDMPSGVPSFTFVTTTVVFVVVGIALFSFASVAATAEIAKMRNRKTTIRIARQDSVRRWQQFFEDETYKFNNTSDGKERAPVVRRLVELLEPLPSNEANTWPEGQRQAILAFVNEAGRAFDNADITYRIQSVNVMWLIYTKIDASTNGRIAELFKERLEGAVDPELASDKFVLLLRQEMHEFDEPFMIHLVEQAIYDWSDDRFATRWVDIRLDQVKQRDIRAFERVKEYLRTTWRDKQKSEKIRNRASILYEQWKKF